MPLKGYTVAIELSLSLLFPEANQHATDDCESGMNETKFRERVGRQPRESGYSQPVFILVGE